MILPVTIVSISGRDDGGARFFASISLALARSQTRRSHLDHAVLATVFLAVPPSIRPTLVVIPARDRSTPRSQARSPPWRDGVAALVRLPSACAGDRVRPDHERTDAFARGHDLAAVARGSVTRT